MLHPKNATVGRVVHPFSHFTGRRCRRRALDRGIPFVLMPVRCMLLDQSV